MVGLVFAIFDFITTRLAFILASFAIASLLLIFLRYLFPFSVLAKNKGHFDLVFQEAGNLPQVTYLVFELTLSKMFNN